MKLLPFVVGVGVGYVLGTRAGRERYEQLARAYRRVADDPSVQAAAGVARAKAGEAVNAGVAAARDRLSPDAPGAHEGPGGARPGANGHEPTAPGRTVTDS